MDPIQQFAKHDAFAGNIGIELLDASPGYAKAQLEIETRHLNGLNTVHGGAIFSLADFVFAAAANAHGTIAMAINVHISYIKAATGGVLLAEAREVSLNPKLGTYSVRVTNEAGELIATFEGMVYRKKEAIPV
jgi:acyl-CoA thioesterase